VKPLDMQTGRISMRVTIIGPVYPYRGGIAHYTAQLAQSLGDAGHSVHTISFKRQYPAWLYPGASDRDPSRNALRVEADYLLDPLYPWTWMQTSQLIARQQPDLVVMQWWTTFWAPAYAWLAAALRRKGVRVVFIIHNVYPHEPRFFDRALAGLALKQGSAFVAQTMRERERLLALLPGRRVELCTLPVYSVLAGQCIPRAEARRILAVEEKTPLLLFFGIIRPYKGLKVLLEALAQLSEADQYPNLLVAGEIWEEKDSYRQLIMRLGLEKRVRLEDRYVPDEEAAVMFSAADMLVAPYLDGTQSGAAGMALGCGLPMVVSEVVAAGIAPENQRNVRVVPAGDVQALAEAIRQMLRQSRDEERAEPAADDWWRLVSTLEALIEPR
jgi:glycosyltransferase involved in cell wall biosynthesis